MRVIQKKHHNGVLAKKAMRELEAAFIIVMRKIGRRMILLANFALAFWVNAFSLPHKN